MTAELPTKMNLRVWGVSPAGLCCPPSAWRRVLQISFGLFDLFFSPVTGRIYSRFVPSADSDGMMRHFAVSHGDGDRYCAERQQHNFLHNLNPAGCNVESSNIPNNLGEVSQQLDGQSVNFCPRKFRNHVGTA